MPRPVVPGSSPKGSSLVLVVVLLVGCASPPPDPPTAVVTSEPSSVCVGDEFRTTLILKASQSAPSLALVPVPPDPEAPQLQFEWAFAGAAYEELGRDASEVQVRTKGDRPLHVTLTATNAGGGRAKTLLSVPLTLPEVERCEVTSCTDGTICLPYQGARVCIAEGECVSNVDCDDVCSFCDFATSRCLPRQVLP